MLRYWLSITAPAKPCETSNVNFKINALRGQCVSIASIIFLLSYFFYGIIQKQLTLGVLCSLLVFVLLYCFNRRGYVRLTAASVMILTQVVGFYLLVIMHQTTGITVLLLSSIMCMIALPAITAILVTVSILAIMMVYMVQMGQIWSELMWTRIVTHIAFGVIEYVACIVVEKILLQANDLQTLVNEQRALEAKNIVLEQEKEAVIRSLMLVRAAISGFENGRLATRVPTSVDANTLKDISLIINILLSKQEKLYASKRELQYLERHIGQVSQVLQMSEQFHTSFEYEFTRTRLDLIIQLLKGKKMIRNDKSGLPGVRGGPVLNKDI
jgi:hypothetical protein